MYTKSALDDDTDMLSLDLGNVANAKKIHEFDTDNLPTAAQYHILCTNLETESQVNTNSSQFTSQKFDDLKVLFESWDCSTLLQHFMSKFNTKYNIK